MKLAATIKEISEIQRLILSNTLILHKSQKLLCDGHSNKINEMDKLFEFMKLELHQKSDLLNSTCNKYNNFWDKKTYSQSGEDSIVAYILLMLGIPFSECQYLDLGANHAKDLSNSFFFYENGAKGVIVEANPLLIQELKFYRNRDTIINKCVSLTSGIEIEFYILSGDGLSTTEFQIVQKVIQINPEIKLVKTVKIETITINEILDNYFDKSPTILNIDIEGKDLEILSSINFNTKRPLIIIAEMIEYKTSLVVKEKNNEISTFLYSKNYIEYAFTGINSIFIDKERI